MKMVGLHPDFPKGESDNRANLMHDNESSPNPHRPLGRGMAFVASLLVLGMFYFYFENSLQARNNPNRDLRIAPGTELVLKRSGDGHYVFPGTINNRPVSFLLDTGATLVSVPADLADELRLDAGAPQRSITANGTVDTRATRIDVLAFGPFVLRGVPANLNPGMAGDQVLLGMSVLKHLEFTQRGDTLVLRALAGE
jgi:aspartyl protease family protein